LFVALYILELIIKKKEAVRLAEMKKRESMAMKLLEEKYYLPSLPPLSS